jgi:hypothetical protein
MESFFLRHVSAPLNHVSAPLVFRDIMWEISGYNISKRAPSRVIRIVDAALRDDK